MYPFEDYSDPLIPQRVKLMRKSKKLTQYDIADAIASSQAKVSRAEKGYEKYDKDDVENAKAALDIADMPISDYGFKIFKKRLYHWRNLYRNKQTEEAAELQKELANLIKIEPYNMELPTLYRLFKTSLLLAERNFEAAKEVLDTVKESLKTMSEECLYFYNSRMGVFHAMQRRHEEAIVYFKKAIEISKRSDTFWSIDDEILQYNTAISYTELDAPTRAIVAISKIKRTKFEHRASSYNLGIDITLAINCYKKGIYDEAEEILLDCLLKAQGLGDKHFIGLTLINLGMTHRYAGNWEKAIKYFNQALDILDKGTYHHAWALYMKMRCQVETEKLFDLERELIQTKKSLEGYDDYTILLETLRYIIYLNRNISRYNINAVEYIENTAIPYFIENSNSLEAIECYKLLERHYLRTNKLKQSLKANRAMFEISERMA